MPLSLSLSLSVRPLKNPTVVPPFSPEASTKKQGISSPISSIMSEQSRLGKISVSNPKVWIVIGVGVAGVLILAEARRRRLRAKRKDGGVFIELFELLPFPQPPPPAARQPLCGLTFAVKDIFDVKDYVTGLGNPDWKRTHEAAEKTSVAVTALLNNGATCVGKTVMDDFGLGITGVNVHYGTPINPQMPSHLPGGSSSGSAVAVASGLVDFALGTDTIGGVRAPASFCGILGFRPSHGVVPTVGVIPNSQSLDTVGWFARDPSILHRVAQILLNLNQLEPRRIRRIIIADDLFQLSKVPKQKTIRVVGRVTGKLSDQLPKHLNFGHYIASNVPSLKAFHEDSTNPQNGISTLKALSSVMLLLQRYEFKTNHEEWIKSTKPRLGPDVSDRVYAAINSTQENIKSLYKVRTEMRAAVRNLLKDDGILAMPTVADPPLKLNSKKGLSAEFHDRAFALLSIASMSGCCQVTIPLGKHDDCPISVSLAAFHGADKFLLDTVLDMYSSLQEQASLASDSSPLPDMNGDMDASELLKEKGNAAYKGRQWNKAVKYYSEAIKLNEINATYYCNRAAAYLELACFQEAEEDCCKAISLDKKNVKAYLRRGTARESLLFYKEALQDFKHALVLEPHNRVASLAEKRLRKLVS
ncbi:outer envelope protein 64, mitochondrial isoform X2 [Diospyros lotus]|uniref:outer envelope protein 64, mitochondrial isoform X2 n=1 Tax=Diospyros lotus TaxID=55363 RepID=UPI00225A53CE|nr:outer envelope protein 64, mitochondrial isoform X2 [Diospyros lotus]